MWHIWFSIVSFQKIKTGKVCSPKKRKHSIEENGGAYVRGHRFSDRNIIFKGLKKDQSILILFCI
jgi:hypothetical protein